MLWKCWITKFVVISSSESQSQSSTASTSLPMMKSSRLLSGLGPKRGLRARATLVVQIGSVAGVAACAWSSGQGFSGLDESPEVELEPPLSTGC